MKGKYELLGLRLRIKLVKEWANGLRSWRGYSFEFPALMIENRRSRRCYPGARYYGSSFGADDRETAWKKAIQLYARALDPVFTLEGKAVPEVETTR